MGTGVAPALSPAGDDKSVKGVSLIVLILKVQRQILIAIACASIKNLNILYKQNMSIP